MHQIAKWFVHCCRLRCAVAAGGDYSIVLTENGELLGFGCDHFGLLARPPSETGRQLLPALLSMESAGQSRRVVIRQVSAGHDHCLAITADGQVISWGSPGRRGCQTSKRHIQWGEGEVLVDAVGALGRATVEHVEGDTFSMECMPAIADRLGSCKIVAVSQRRT